MARYPVTVAQYTVFIEDGGYDDIRWWSESALAWRRREWDSTLKEEDFASKDTFNFYKDWLAARTVDHRQRSVWWEEQRIHSNRPVYGVCWFEAQAYCMWLDEKIRQLSGVDWIESHYHVRLPTEAEWEKAARAGDLRCYHWVGEWSDYRANANRRISRVSTVGMYPGGANPLDLHDLMGNVWEWTRSVYAPYPYDPKKSELSAPKPGDLLVLRGGSWIVDARGARCAARLRYDPDNYFDDVGFRVVVSLASEH